MHRSMATWFYLVAATSPGRMQCDGVCRAWVRVAPTGRLRRGSGTLFATPLLDLKLWGAHWQTQFGDPTGSNAGGRYLCAACSHSSAGLQPGSVKRGSTYIGLALGTGTTADSYPPWSNAGRRLDVHLAHVAPSNCNLVHFRRLPPAWSTHAAVTAAASRPLLPIWDRDP